MCRVIETFLRGLPTCGVWDRFGLALSIRDAYATVSQIGHLGLGFNGPCFFRLRFSKVSGFVIKRLSSIIVNRTYKLCFYGQEMQL